MLYNRNTVAIPDAIVAMERNLGAVLKLAGVDATVKASMSGNATTASVLLERDSNGRVEAVVTFPVVALDRRLTRAECDRWVGYFIHEICHVLYTDPQVWAGAVAEGLGHLVNGLEDVRIERRLVQSALVGNARARLTELLAWAVGETPANYDPNDPRRLPWTLAMIGRVRLCGYALPGVASHEAKLSPAMRKTIDRVMRDLDRARSTQDVLEIARWLTAEKKPEADQPKGDQPKPPKDQPKGDQPKGDGEVCEEGEEGDQGEGDQGEGDDDQGEGDDQGDDQGDQGDDGAGGFSGPMEAVPDMDPMKRSKSRKDDHHRYREGMIANILARAVREAAVPLERVREFWKDVALHSERLAREARGCSRLRNQVAGALRAPALDDLSRRRSAGRVDSHAMGRLAAGDFDRPFARRSRRDGFETEIVILLDGSSSMSLNGRLWRAAVFALTIAQAAEQVGVKCEIAQFVGNVSKALKLPGERLASPGVMARAVTAALACEGSTPLCEALARSAERLSLRAIGKRKIVFTATDGEDDLGVEAVQKVVAHCEARGVEIVGISIDSSVTGAFANEVRVDVGDDMAAVGLGLLARVLSQRGAA